MKALAITPRQAGTARLVELPTPAEGEVSGGLGVLVKILQVGLDGTDRELCLGQYGAAPPGFDFLVIGHESFGRVEKVGPNVTELRPGDYVVATVRRPGGSIYDAIGTCDMTSDQTCYERGISLLHGFATEHYVDDADYIVKVPATLKHIGVLMEPMSIVEKGVRQAYDIQRRLKVWRPTKAAVMGAGCIGLLAALVLRLRGIEVRVFARSRLPNRRADLAHLIGAQYVSTEARPLGLASQTHGPFDLIFEATGASPIVFQAAHLLAMNGVLIMSSVTGGNETIEVESDRLNLDFVLGNKVMFGTVNAHRGYFEQAVTDFARAEAEYPGWLSALLSHPVRGLENYREALRILHEERHATKTYLIVSEG